MKDHTGGSAARNLFAALATSLVAACGGGGGSDATTTYTQGADVPPNDAEGSRFLTQATLGPSQKDIDFLRFIGYSAWFDDQAKKPVSKEKPYIDGLVQLGVDPNQTHRMRIWWHNAMLGDDQLRQRVAFALSQIFVVSDQHPALSGDVEALVAYYDMLAKDAFGNYRQLLEDVTLSPAMGKYLNMLQNRKADPANNIRPDENYAREVMQLFSIGLVQLNADGTTQLDGSNLPIPTYDQNVVEAMAADFTGWNYAKATNWWSAKENTLPMTNWIDYHDQTAKTIFDGIVLPAGQTGEKDLADALDALFAHHNVGPFIGKQLIQRLVTSNPSPAYVARVSAVFDDDGTGVRGDLLAVVKAILMDSEARAGYLATPDTFGKVREPILRQTELWRAFHAKSASGRYEVYYPESYFGEAPLRSPTVFNFYSPFFAPPGDIADNGLVAPELQIATHTLIVTATNEFNDLVFWGYKGNKSADPNTALIDVSKEIGLAATPDALLDDLNALLMGGTMSATMRQTLLDELNATPLDDGGLQRVQDAIYLIVTSPEGVVQK